MHGDRGFTLVELIVAVAMIGILAAIALPSYAAYVLRSKVPPGLDALTAYQSRMEQKYQDTGNYASVATPTACAIPAPTVANFVLVCALNTDQVFVATVTGSGPMLGISYSTDSAGTHKTVSHPKGIPATNCWSIRGSKCDT